MRLLAFFACLFAVACSDDQAKGEGPRTSVDDMAVPPVDLGPDAAPPAAQSVAFIAPLDGAVIPGRFVQVEGSVGGPIQAVTVNGEAAAVSRGHFSLRMELESGSHELVAQAGAAEARVRITVDAAPPRIDITTPARATYVADGQVDLEFTITDDAGLQQVLFDGDLAVDPGLGPMFALSGLPLRLGWNVLRLQATDSAGNQAQEHVAVLHGEIQDPAALIPAALRLHIGPTGINSLKAVALSYLTSLDLTSFVPNPLLDQGIFHAEIARISYADPPILDLTPTPGSVQVRMRLNEVVIALSLQISDNEVYQVGAGAAAVEVTGSLVPRVEGGQIQIRLDDLQVVFTDLEVQAGGVPNFQDDPAAGQALIEQLASQAVSLVADRILPDLLGRLLDRIDDPIELNLLGAQLTLALVPDVIVVSERGISARVSVGVTLANPAPGEPAIAGYIGTRTPWDGVPDTDAVGIAVDDDLLNLVLYQVWRAGVLLPRLDRQSDLGRDAGLVTSLLGSLIRRANPNIGPETPIAIGTHMPLPPVVTVRKENGAVGLALGVGDMVVDVDTDDAAANDLLEGSASLELVASVGVTSAEPGALALDLEVIDTTAAFDVTTPALRGEAENSVEAPLNELLGRLGALLPNLLRDIPLPTFAFVTFVNLHADAIGPDGTFIGLFGDVAPPQ